ncbi:hypothetical protein [Emcibacter sp.]|uniref:hypothetical protein n=1 Tax=Emcibacter sp. TaxID=1979954 RepID=UPI002AA7C406|nr:hypothetical protein [Emcibacter sp.]
MNRNTLIFVLVGVGAVLSLAWGLLTTNSPEKEEEAQPKFYFHLYADVEFDGEHVVYDDYILCEAYVYKYLDRAADRGYVMGSIAQGKRLAGGGVLFLKTPHFCGYGNKAWNKNRRQQPIERLTDQAALQAIEPRTDYIPLFYWSDDDTHPTVMESYESETYFKQPYARLKINRVVVDDYTTVLPDGVEGLDYREKLPDPMSPSFLRAKNSEVPEEKREEYKSIGGGWVSYALHPVFEEEWETAPSLREMLGGLGAGSSIFQDDSLYALVVNEVDRDKQSDATHKFSDSYSIAHYLHSKNRKSGLTKFQDAGTSAQLSGRYLDEYLALERIDEVVPLKCVRLRCWVEEKWLGIRFYYPLSKLGSSNSVRTIEYNEFEIRIRPRSAFYDPKTKIIWILASQPI